MRDMNNEEMAAKLEANAATFERFRGGEANAATFERFRGGETSAFEELLEACTGAKVASVKVQTIPKPVS